MLCACLWDAAQRTLTSHTHACACAQTREVVSGLEREDAARSAALAEAQRAADAATTRAEAAVALLHQAEEAHEQAAQQAAAAHADPVVAAAAVASPGVIASVQRGFGRIARMALGDVAAVAWTPVKPRRPANMPGVPDGAATPPEATQRDLHATMLAAETEASTTTEEAAPLVDDNGSSQRDQ